MTSTSMTTAFRISNRVSGADLGIYAGATSDEAIRAMLADARCSDEPSSELVATEITTTHLALYVGAGGPISVELECGSLDEACEWVREHGRYAFNDAENALDLPVGYDDRDGIDEALARRWWRVESSCDEGDWSIHRRA